MTTTVDDVWRILAELSTAQKETERRFQETERILKEQSSETDRQIKEVSQEIKQVSKQIKQVNKQIGELGNRLGEFVEHKLRPSAVKLFRQWGINVHELHPGVTVQRIDGGLEIDLLVVNDTEVVVIEVKSKLTQTDIDEHLQRLDKFKRFMPVYHDKTTYGAVGAMVVTEQVANYAYQKGLFVLAPNGEDVIITNNSEFKPHVW